MTAPRGLPHVWETERSVLGGLLLDGTLLDEVRGLLVPSDFHKPAHGRLFALICEMADRGIVQDLVTVPEQVEQQRIAEEVGGIAYIVGLPNACLFVDNVPAHAQRVLDAAQRRAVRLALRAADEQVDDYTVPTHDIIDAAQGALFALDRSSGRGGGYRSLTEIVDERMAALQDRAENPGTTQDVLTGWVDLDRMIHGMAPGQLIIVAARPAMGKSAFGMGLAANAARAGVGVGVIELEMVGGELADRLLAGGARVTGDAIVSGEVGPEDLRRLYDAHAELRTLPIWIDDVPGQSIAAIRSSARRLKVQHPNLGLLIVDYLQLAKGTKGPKQAREQEVAEIARGLSELAKELHVPVVALSQLNRSLEGRTSKRPLMSDLRESGEIEQAANVILFLYRDEVYNEDSPHKGVAEVIVAKQRRGRTGTVSLAFRGAFYLFQNLAADYRPPPRVEPAPKTQRRGGRNEGADPRD